MRSVFFIPPLSKMSGGLANIYDIVLLLHELGHELALCHMPQGAPGLESFIDELKKKSGEISNGHNIFKTSDKVAENIPASALSVQEKNFGGSLKKIDIEIMQWDNCRLNAGDIWCIPEGWPMAIAKGADAGARTVVYAQNWLYLLGVLPQELCWRQMPVEFLAVSEPVAWFMRSVLGLEVKGTLAPMVRDCFYLNNISCSRPENCVRIGWMPRKNSALARQIQQIALEIINNAGAMPNIEWVELKNMNQAELAKNFAACHIFMMSSLAEGFGLPPLEAMASGCVPVGFAGLGGWEYMVSSPLSPCHKQVYASLPPGFELSEKPWGPNGFYAPEGDVISAGMALAAAIKLAYENGQDWKNLQAQAIKTAAYFSREAMLQRLNTVWTA